MPRDLASSSDTPPERDAEHLASARERARREYARAYRERNRERIRESNRESERVRRQKAVSQREQRQKARERARDWARGNPERAAANKRLYAKRHPERVREHQRNYYERHREEIAARATARRDAAPERTQERGRQRRSKNKVRRAELQRQYRSDPAVYERMLAQNRERKRLDRRLAAAGLPLRKLHRVPAREVRANAAAAAEFYSRNRTMQERARIRSSYSPTPPELLADWARTSALARRRAALLHRFESDLRKQMTRHGARIRGEVELDSRARVLRGKAPLNLDEEVRRRIADKLLDRTNDAPWLRRQLALRPVVSHQQLPEPLTWAGPNLVPHRDHPGLGASNAQSLASRVRQSPVRDFGHEL
ncbi:hypothetical protein GCM10027052_09090 [Parafrigoribacterium mesophilum]|uniref:hypothetical protein n=1 Tax=Parafrigoribacterium mesophilum TaxID=433646 RepID=UPI0031FCB9B4